jgi:HEAT repeat protein
MRYEASGACGELGEIEAIPSLIELINDPDTEVQLAAIQALGKIGGSEAKESLEECLNSSNEVICEAAEEALNELEADEDPFSFKHETGLT